MVILSGGCYSLLIIAGAFLTRILYLLMDVLDVGQALSNCVDFLQNAIFFSMKTVYCYTYPIETFIPFFYIIERVDLEPSWNLEGCYLVPKAACWKSLVYVIVVQLLDLVGI